MLNSKPSADEITTEAKAVSKDRVAPGKQSSSAGDEGSDKVAVATSHQRKSNPAGKPVTGA